jgi:ATP-binding cassette subfamily C protein/ATP-binding cassette subfamily C protein CydC/ATP-binding cassette subfamily C protein CydCD
MVRRLVGRGTETAAERERRLATARAELAARTVDVLRGSADLTVFGANGQALADADRAAAELAAVERRAAWTTAGAGALGMLAQAATAVAVTVLAVGAVADGSLAPVMVPVLALVALISFEPVLPLVPAMRHLLESRDAVSRVMAVLDAAAPVSEPDHPESRPPSDAVVEVRGLSVRYAADRDAALDGVDLRLEPGRRVAVVGASGSGKSTLLAALMRFAEPESGSILIDGVDISRFDSDDVQAGRTIGKMLAFFFLNTVVVMSLVAWWTWTVRFGN